MKKSFELRLRSMRETNNLSQQQLADMLGISRPTLAQMELGNRKVKAEELQRLSEIFDISIEILLSGAPHDTDITITSDQSEKFKQLMLYILTKVWSKYNVGKTVLYKLLYFSEFDYYELTWEQLSWYPFVRLPMWPAPYDFNTLVDEMKQNNKLATVTTKMIDYYQQRFVPNVAVGDWFSDQQKKCIDDVLANYSNYSASEISEKSHEDKPRQMTKDMQLIEYDLVRFREYPYSPLARANAKHTAQQEAIASGFADDTKNEPDLYEDYRQYV